MARVTCSDCGLSYDDTYRWTYCPHDEFQMRTLVTWTDQDGVVHEEIATSIEQLNEIRSRGE